MVVGMNIDRKKFLSLLEQDMVMDDETIHDYLNDCEIKRDCNKCTLKNNFGSCQNCSVNKSDLYQEEQNELDNLFIGAPVMMERYEDKWELSDYCDGSIYKLRLPTVAESPRNVWLAKWLTRPSELIMNVYVRMPFKGGISNIIPLNKLKEGTWWCWDKVEAVMILEDFK